MSSIRRDYLGYAVRSAAGKIARLDVSVKLIVGKQTAYYGNLWKEQHDVRRAHQ